jgi:hypothetical protein
MAIADRSSNATLRRDSMEMGRELFEQAGRKLSQLGKAVMQHAYLRHRHR